MQPGIENRTYYVYFNHFNREGLPWTWAFVFGIFIGKNKEFGHVEIFYVNGHNTITSITSAPWLLYIQEYDRSLEHHIGILKRSKVTACVEFESQIVKDSYQMRGLLYCVSVVKALLGIRGLFIITPKKLYLKLKQLGGKILWEPQNQF